MAKTKKLDDDLLLDQLTGVFSRLGFEGASLSRISEATGLQRASLYYRFPEGKSAMARAVLERAGRRFAEHILLPLQSSGTSGAPQQRLRETARRLSEFYRGGNASCLLDTLSLGDGPLEIRRLIAELFELWRDAFTAVAEEAGLAAWDAERRAEDAVVALQGALVLSRATGDAQPFQRTLEDLPDRLTAPVARG